jgi:hydrogenase nickel incorporation protein HypB
MSKEIEVAREVLQDNSQNAETNRQRFRREGVYVVNLMSGPGAGKTTLLERTAEALGKQVRMAVVTGDIATTRDADRIGRAGVRALQINTGGGCHIEAHQIARAVDDLGAGPLDLLIIENVGNLVCPAEFDLGEHDKVMMLSCSEGHDKPGKYPLMFKESRALILNKIDLLPYTNFDVEAALADARAINPAIDVIKMAAWKGEGLQAWVDWLLARIAATRRG